MLQNIDKKIEDPKYHGSLIIGAGRLKGEQRKKFIIAISQKNVLLATKCILECEYDTVLENIIILNAKNILERFEEEIGFSSSDALLSLLLLKQINLVKEIFIHLRIEKSHKKIIKTYVGKFDFEHILDLMVALIDVNSSLFTLLLDEFAKIQDNSTSKLYKNQIAHIANILIDKKRYLELFKILKHLNLGFEEIKISPRELGTIFLKDGRIEQALYLSSKNKLFSPREILEHISLRDVSYNEYKLLKEYHPKILDELISIESENVKNTILQLLSNSNPILYQDLAAYLINCNNKELAYFIYNQALGINKLISLLLSYDLSTKFLFDISPIVKILLGKVTAQRLGLLFDIVKEQQQLIELNPHFIFQEILEKNSVEMITKFFEYHDCTAEYKFLLFYHATTKKSESKFRKYLITHYVSPLSTLDDLQKIKGSKLYGIVMNYYNNTYQIQIGDLRVSIPFSSIGKKLRNGDIVHLEIISQNLNGEFELVVLQTNVLSNYFTKYENINIRLIVNRDEIISYLSSGEERKIKHALLEIQRNKLFVHLPVEDIVKILVKNGNISSLKEAIILINKYRLKHQLPVEKIIREFIKGSNRHSILYGYKLILEHGLSSLFSKEMVVGCTITKISPSRVFVLIEKTLQPASIYIGELAYRYIPNILDFEHNGEKLDVGQRLIAKVISVDEIDRVDLSIKILHEPNKVKPIEKVRKVK